MAKTHITRFTIEFGDCDPAGIVFYPNFFRWMDAASLHYLRAAGVPSWRELEAQTGIIGTPIVVVSARFLRPASYGDAIEVETTINEWRSKSFVFKHVIRCGGDVLVEGEEVRIFARRNVEDALRIEAVATPESIRRLCDVNDKNEEGTDVRAHGGSAGS
jgi:4-hydroxybenzoyl-CoA thioesterase